MAFKDWSTTAADNDDADAAINWAEGQAPSTVNGSARAMMANLKIALGHILSIDDFAVNGDGVTSDVTPFQNAMSELSDRGGGQLIIPKATYLFTVTGDSDSIVIPSNVGIWCEPGVVFEWDFWGSPLFAIVNRTNVRFHGNGAKFLWTGTFGSTSGSSDKFSYGRSIAAYEWCSHIVVVGSSNCAIDDVSCEGEATSNIQNNFIVMHGTSAGAVTTGNRVTNIIGNDVCQVLAFDEQSQFAFRNIYSDRYANDSDALYGPPHVVYATPGTVESEAGTIDGVIDRGTPIDAFTDGSHTIQVKKLKNSTIKNVYSRRPEGAVVIQDCEDIDVEFRYHSSSTDDETNTGVVYFPDPTQNEHVRVKGTVIQTAQRNFSLVNMGGISAGSKNLYCDLDINVVRTGDGTETLAAVYWVGNYGQAKITHTNKGSGGARTIVEARNTSEDNNFYVRSLGAVPNPRIGTGGTGTNSRNTFYCSGDSVVYYDTNEFTPANGNAVIWEGARQYQSRKVIGVTTNPTTTFQIPKTGAYLVHINLTASDRNHARSGLYWVVFDDASVNDYTTAQLLGTQISKGGSAPSALSLAVDNTGLCTITSTAGSNTWVLDYGYRQISGHV